jgi:alpha-glucosidase
VSDRQEVPARWWQGAVFYQIYPRSFADASGDGVGDLPGILAHLDHLSWLGVDAIWLSPFFPSPMADFGYDVADYCGVDPLFGSLADFDALVAAAHARGLRLVIDWVPAHTSSEHPWFREARRSRTSPKRDWYVWRDPGPGGELPNNWRSAFGERPPAWTLDEGTGQLYLHSFLPKQPDLDWSHPEVRRALHDTLRFWLDRGVDGFRADVIHNIGKHPDLPDVPTDRAAIPHCVLNDEPVTHEYLREIRALLDARPGEPMMVGEVFLLDTERVATYYGRDDELHLAFNFPPLFAAWSAEAWRACVETTVRAFDPLGAWPTWALSNHDVSRHRTRYGSEARARAAAVLLLGLRGTPFLYMGEELGLEDAAVPEARVVDPGGRDGCRAPIPWRRGGTRGWGDEPWLPWPPDSDARSVEAQREDADSFLHLYRRLLRARRASPALAQGRQRLLEAPDGVLAWERVHGADRRVVVVNFRDAASELSVAAGTRVEVASDGRGEGQGFRGRVGPDQGLVLR